jgi:hypothetical protein
LSIKRELQAFYAKQGITGQHRRKAMRYDLKAVRKYGNGASELCLSFVWSKTPQGFRYWAARDWAMGNTGYVPE